MASNKTVPRKNVKTKFGDHKCKICNKTFTERAGLKQHIQTHATERPFSCELCPHTCKTKKYLSKHVKTVHNGVRKHACTHCDRKFLFKCLLEKHMYIHTDERPYKCEVCGKGFNTAYSLTVHGYIHADVKPYKCPHCPHACRDASSMRRHRERHAGVRRRYECKLCGKSYKTKHVLKVHISEAHLKVDLKKKPCTVCGKMFRSVTALNNHVKVVHDRVYSCTCDICGVELSNRYNMAAHLTKHVHFKPFQCTFDGCLKTFKDKSGLKKHTIIHYPDQQFPCSLCGRRFARAHRLAAHMAQHRRKVKSVACEHCGTSFYNKKYLDNHIRKKHGVKQKYICDICGLLTYNKPSIVMHLKYRHPSEMDRQCKICKKNFKKHQYLKQHYWNTHCIKYNRAPRKPKVKKKKIIIKEEPKDSKEMELIHEVKVEPLSESDPDTKATEYSRGVLSEDITRAISENSSKKAPATRFEEFFIEHIMRPDGDLREKLNINPDEKELKNIYKHLIIEEKTDGEIKELLEGDGNDSSRKCDDDDDDHDVSSNCDDDDANDPDYIGDGGDGDNGGDDGVGDDGVGDVGNGDDVGVGDGGDGGEERSVQTKGIKINTHQCYVCFKLYDTKEELIDHCKEHFDLCNTTTLKKCPLCDHVAQASLTRHAARVHGIRVETPCGKVRERRGRNNGGSRFYCEVDAVGAVEVIPSVRSLNRRACLEVDRRRREEGARGLIKKKLVKRNGEWVVEKVRVEATVTVPDPKGDYLETMKAMSLRARNNGRKMLFPCDRCEKICQTLSALKLHARRHEANPKPFRKKVWKHKTSVVPKVVEKAQAVNPNRYAAPKPIQRKHKCDPKLKEFYERNIRGGDVEFWHFLKIFNRMSRENVNDFADLERSTEFGMHVSLPQDAAGVAEEVCKREVCNGVRRRVGRAFERKVMIGRKDHERRKIRIDALRRHMMDEANS